MTIGGSVIERYVQYGAFTDADLSLSATVVRDALPSTDGTIPSAMAFNSGAVGSLQDCLIERSGVGLLVRSATASVERLALRDASLLGTVVLEGSTVDIHTSTFERTTGVGLYVRDSTATLDQIIVRETAPKDGLYGDGVTAAVASVDIKASRIESSARCGVSNFGGVVRIGGVALECNAIDLDGEVYEGSAFTFEEGQGELTCGCGGEADECLVESSSIGPPSIEGVTD
jgi:hypothetical protein